MDLANHFAELIRRENILELYVEPSLSLVCFRWAGRGEEDQQKLLDAVKRTGDLFVIHTKLEEKIVIRLACGGLEQSFLDIDNAYDVIKSCVKNLTTNEQQEQS